MVDQTVSNIQGVTEAERIRDKEVRRQRIGAVLRYAMLGGVGLLMLYPLIWLVGASFKTNAEIFNNPGFWPENPTLDGYINGWKTSTPYTFGTFFLNTLWIVLPKMIGTAISCTAVAYGFARFDFPFKKILFATLIATLLLPNVVTRIPQYLLFRDLGWLDTYLPLWVPSAFAGDAFFVFMLVQFLRAIPRDMEEAARVDGASTMQTLLFIVVPLLMPALISVCLFQFMWTMNDFLGPLIYLSSVEKYPVSLALKLSIDTTEAFDWNRILAMSVLAITPALVVFFVAQKYFIDGISAGGIKG
ncbi:carbohydrate ABC transporter permease [Rhizobium sp. CG4]|jgi:oligogalacturonide transport system permease protein|uniref:carbohydrate ABC transporter permease n=1 Tax=Agrobacterium sp. Azo12 TaxID=3031129 RepID=UPI0017852F82|nr:MULTISPECIES: carbohydrate ABC transporter permease [Rhizobium/Agrobacterium group]MBD9388127.1 carbohydrate ABC transporter permease [Agrobacterium sp. AGB01]MCM2457719.1 carbohydrate ABC transporter permease [Rhizobium sp. CG4]MCS4243185.1 oligogalacturonide transport system permease protein [Rhizobium sp. BIGb0125]MDO5897821.1 carbohydrate ABC transporter permease [Agrobacterium sp. Azo12]